MFLLVDYSMLTEIAMKDLISRDLGVHTQSTKMYNLFRFTQS